MERGLFERFLLKGMPLAMAAGRAGFGAWSETGKDAVLFLADERLNGMAALKLTGERRITGAYVILEYQ